MTIELAHSSPCELKPMILSKIYMREAVFNNDLCDCVHLVFSADHFGLRKDQNDVGLSNIWIKSLKCKCLASSSV